MNCLRLSFSALLAILILLQCTLSTAEDSVRTFTTQDKYGRPIQLLDDRRPALYTKDFGDCQGDSLLNITRFDAGFYKDNMTVAFHFEGDSSIKQASVMRKNQYNLYYIWLKLLI